MAVLLTFGLNTFIHGAGLLKYPVNITVYLFKLVIAQLCQYPDPFDQGERMGIRAERDVGIDGLLCEGSVCPLGGSLVSELPVQRIITMHQNHWQRSSFFFNLTGSRGLSYLTLALLPSLSPTNTAFPRQAHPLVGSMLGLTPVAAFH